MERVGIYNRCSTEEESQKNALASQVAESRELALKMGWHIAEQYIESETGTVAYKRGEYQRLLSDMEKDRFDIVMIKSIDRLTRCARDWYFFLSRLTENGLRLYLYIEGKFYTPDDNLISGIKAILAEDFSRELSKKIKNAHRRRQEKKSGCNITCEMFGWNKTAKDVYEINEQEAEYYRTAFTLAKEGKGFYSISNILYELGARGRRGNKISEVQWRKMLYTPRAHGTMILNQKTYDFDRKKYVEVPRERWIVMENALPPIVSREYQQEVIRLLQERAEKSPCRNSQRKAAGKKQWEEAEEEKSQRAGAWGKALMKGKYPLSRKLVCAECGKPYYRTLQRSKEGQRTVWKCSTFLSGGRNKEKSGTGCGNIHLTEDGVLRGIGEALGGEEVFSQEEWRELAKDAVRTAQKALAPQSSQAYMAAWEKEYKKLAAKKDVLVEKLLGAVISDEDFKRVHGDISGQMKALLDKINGIKDEEEQYNSYKTRIRKIKEELEKESLMQKALVMELLRGTDHIEVHRDGTLILWMDKRAVDSAEIFRGKEGIERADLYGIRADYIREYL